jgi:G3E family GTPase
MSDRLVAADISVAVIHDRARRSCRARRREVVNNCAVPARMWPADVLPRLDHSHSRRTSGRPLAEPEALAPTSHRKRPQEGHDISSMDGRAKGRTNPQRQKQTMNESKQWQQHRAFGALDWASQKHTVIVVNEVGKVSEEFEIEHSALGWKKFR